MDNQIKETILKTLKRRKDVLTHKVNFNVNFLEGRVKEWKQELESKQEYLYNSVGGLGIQTKIYQDTHLENIKKFEEKLERSYKEIAELEKAIEYIENN